MAEQLAQQDYREQLAWLASTLDSTTTKWKIVVGHHPIGSQHTHNYVMSCIQCR